MNKHLFACTTSIINPHECNMRSVNSKRNNDNLFTPSAPETHVPLFRPFSRSRSAPSNPHGLRQHMDHFCRGIDCIGSARTESFLKFNHLSCDFTYFNATILFTFIISHLKRSRFSHLSIGFSCLFAAHREMRTITNYFLLNLSIADLLMSSLNCMFNFIYMLNSDWPFGSLYCSVNNFLGNVTVATSVFTLVAISFDR